MKIKSKLWSKYTKEIKKGSYRGYASNSKFAEEIGISKKSKLK